MKSSLSVIPFMDHAFCTVFKKSLPYPRSSRFSSMLYSRTFIVLYFTFTSMTHYELIFVRGGSISRFIFLHVQFFHIFLKRLSFFSTVFLFLLCCQRLLTIFMSLLLGSLLFFSFASTHYHTVLIIMALQLSLEDG